jgi:DNA-binding HxlR family transcriptional regulator
MENTKIENLKTSCPCTIERGIRILGGKWKASILWHLKGEPVRFNELSRIILGASKKMIAQRLKELEEEGLITRQVNNERPISVVYQATEFGLSALSVLETLRFWVDEHDL